MSLLSEQDRNQLEDDLEQQIGKNAFDAIEAAILAKLASAELPEPVSAQFQTLDTSDWHNFIDAEHQANTKEDGRWPMRYLFTAAQLHEAHAQGFAAGAASQLAEKPSGYLWAPKKKPELAKLAFQPEPSVQLKALGYISQPLYTRREA